jgi:hypothetical protein
MKKGCPHSGGSPFVLDHKKRANHKPDSVLTIADKCLSFISVNDCSLALTAYPPTSGEQPSNAGLRGVAPHRVYLISLWHYPYILSVALVLASRRTGVTRYDALWCPDFPLLA